MDFPSSFVNFQGFSWIFVDFSEFLGIFQERKLFRLVVAISYGGNVATAGQLDTVVPFC